MTLTLDAEQPAETEASTSPNVAPQPTQELANIGTFITVDLVPLRVSERPDGSLVIQPGSRNPLVLDRHQAGALRAALAEGD